MIVDGRFIHRYVGASITCEDGEWRQQILPLKIDDIVADDVIRSADVDSVLVNDVVNDVVGYTFITMFTFIVAILFFFKKWD